jgi:hypothetical protein
MITRTYKSLIKKIDNTVKPYLLGAKLYNFLDPRYSYNLDNMEATNMTNGFLISRDSVFDFSEYKLYRLPREYALFSHNIVAKSKYGIFSYYEVESSKFRFYSLAPSDPCSPGDIEAFSIQLKNVYSRNLILVGELDLRFEYNIRVLTDKLSPPITIIDNESTTILGKIDYWDTKFLLAARGRLKIFDINSANNWSLETKLYNIAEIKFLVPNLIWIVDKCRTNTCANIFDLRFRKIARSIDLGTDHKTVSSKIMRDRIQILTAKFCEATLQEIEL